MEAWIRAVDAVEPSTEKPRHLWDHACLKLKALSSSNLRRQARSRHVGIFLSQPLNAPSNAPLSSLSLPPHINKHKFFALPRLPAGSCPVLCNNDFPASLSREAEKQRGRGVSRELWSNRDRTGGVATLFINRPIEHMEKSHPSASQSTYKN